MAESMSTMLTIIHLDIQLRIHREQMGTKKTDWQIMSLYMMGGSLNVGDGECVRADKLWKTGNPRHQRCGVQRGQNYEHMGI